MRAKGITYDTGWHNGLVSTRESFERADVERDLRAIREDLRCTAVRITGGDLDRIELAARIAAGLGLEVWWSPFSGHLDADELHEVLVDCADRAERSRLEGHEVVLVAGAELTLCTAGFLPGATFAERMALLGGDPGRLVEAVRGAGPALNAFLGRVVAGVRERFGGRVTYAAIPIEDVDWEPFDLVGLDLYRTAEIADRFAGAVEGVVARGKPVAITEFGCATFRGAGDVGARAVGMVEWGEDGRTTGLRGDPVRDEAEQAGVVLELLDVFEAAGVDSAFLCTFSCHHLAGEFDAASYGVVRALDERRWEPKAAFHAVGERYGRG
ncbi:MULTISPECIES: hypothetical protein [Actinosynnema]|uniref:hypothetical protein n=1 Tax=Actinosynnema TaxID=40566 RepID=UPI0020A3FD0C|nr:hypothetical protein [Actinosynnema pretiosum]MCP2095873.1 hypothetical protein [Actinosynnema pretiosum]